MRNKIVTKLVSALISACLLFSSFGVAYGATVSATTDIKGHWAESQISAWIDKDLIKGYEDGSFKPENKITRAEFIALINRSFGFIETTKIAFSDVASDNWAYTEIARAVKAGYITGYANGTIGASNPISRQEVAVIVSRLLKLKATDGASTSAFQDASRMASWSKIAIGEVVAEQIMKGYDADQTFRPEASITRAEAVVTLDRAKDVHSNMASTVTYNEAGSYGPATGIETVNKNVAVNAAGVTLKNMIINGDLLLGEGIGNGDAFLENIKVTGTVTVQGGGENSIHFNNSVLVDIIIDKKSGTGIVRIVSEGTTTVALVIVNSPVNIQETNSTGTGFGDVNISSALPAGSKVTLQGSFNTVNVSAQQIQVDVPEGTIQNVNANSTATGMSLNLSQGATINELILDAVVSMMGQGTIVLATINTVGSTFETPATTTTTPPTNPAPAPLQSPTQTPVGVNRQALTTAITAANTLIGAHQVGEAQGNVSETTHTTYISAITAATVTRDAASSTQVQVDIAVTTLASATTAFEQLYVVVNTSVLTTAITAATELLGMHIVGAANGNVSQGTYDTYNSAIVAATVIKTAAGSTQAQVDDAVIALGTATVIFEGSTVVVTLESLTLAIADAAALLNAHQVGEANGNVTEDVYGTYNSAIEAATIIETAVSTTQEQADEAIVTLDEATAVFQLSFVTIDLSDLTSAIEAATAFLDAHPVGEANGNVPEEAHNAYSSAIEAATVIKTAVGSTQAQVDGALEALDEATINFEDEFYSVTTTALASAIESASTLLLEHPGGAFSIVSQDDYDTYHAVITSATTISTAVTSTQDDVDGAVLDLASATTAFSESFRTHAVLVADRDVIAITNFSYLANDPNIGYTVKINNTDSFNFKVIEWGAYVPTKEALKTFLMAHVSASAEHSGVQFSDMAEITWSGERLVITSKSYGPEASVEISAYTGIGTHYLHNFLGLGLNQKALGADAQ